MIDGSSETPIPANTVRKAISIGAKRTLESDIELGLNQLTQVTIRSLSPDRNDTFTAMLCLDRLGAALSLLAERRFPSAVWHDAEGRPCLMIRPTTFTEVVDRSFQQIHFFAGERMIIAAHMLRTLRIVAVHTRCPEGRTTLRRHITAVHEESRKHLGDRIGIEAVEQEFRAAVAALEDDSRAAA